MINEVSTMAVDIVDMIDNSTVLHDEFIVHRLGLLPIRVATSQGVDQFLDSSDCPCDSYCDHCSVQFTLDEINHGPEETKTVFSSDLIPQTEGIEVIGYSSRAEANMSGTEHEGRGIVIAQLGIGQRLWLKAVAKKGIGKAHAKWSPVAVATYTFEPKIVLNDARLDEITDQQRLALVESCPTKVYTFDERSKKVVLANESACMFCNQCVKLGRDFKEKGDHDNVVSVEAKKNRFVFVVETVGSLRPEEVVLQALRKMQSKIQESKKDCMELLSQGRFESDGIEGIKDILFKDEGGFI